VTASIATSDPRATAAGAELLEAGATAVDAAVAAALVLYVVEPMQCGLGGDAFLIHVGSDGDVTGLDGSGALPIGLDDAGLAAAGFDTVPARGPATATVPGAFRLLEDAVARYGSLPIGRLAAPAIALAANGFEVRPTLAAAARRAATEIGGDPVLGPLYVPNSRPVDVGDVVVNGVLADRLTELCRDGSQLLHGGPLGRAVAATIRGAGGFLSEDDLARHVTLPVDLVSTQFRGSTVWELPPPTQGIAVLHALDAISAELDAVETPDDWRRVIALMDAAMARAGFDVSSIGARPNPAKGDTTYIAAVDAAGAAASLITSVFGDFGAHFGIPELGAPIGNRATMLRALRRPMAPGQKPPHTTIRAAVTRDGSLQFVLGVAGGFMQPQAQVQILIRMLEQGLAPQAAIDAPRFRIGFGGVLALEAGHPLCESMPEAAAQPPGLEGFGAAQVASRSDAGADPRRDGTAAVIA
jgi:gamma-glutamyltranspeptidase/glutathione hydrolase